MGTEPLADINDLAWDPSRDSATERQSLLRELDPLDPSDFASTFDPDRRTRGGLPLGERARLLLLGASVEDLEVIANETNLRAEVDDDDQLAALRSAVEAYEELLGAHRLLARDSDETTLDRMPLPDRRRAREFQNRIAALRGVRYDGHLLRRPSAEAALRHWQRRLEEAREAGNDIQASQAEAVLVGLRAELGPAQ